MALRLINGTTPADTAKQRMVDRDKKAPKPSVVLQCPRCGGRDVMEVKNGVVLENGKLHGGIKLLVCACCLVKGERIVLA